MKRGVLLGAILTSLCIAGPVASETAGEGEILLGQSCALKGPAKALGKGMRTGLTVYFDKVNQAGGLGGRQIKLLTLNDSYTPKKCVIATNILIKKRNVFAIIGEVGTPTSKVALPICEENDVPFICPFTGAGLLRTPFRKWAINLRGSYAQEMETLTQLLVDQDGHEKVA